MAFVSVVFAVSGTEVTPAVVSAAVVRVVIVSVYVVSAVLSSAAEISGILPVFGAVPPQPVARRLIASREAVNISDRPF